MEPLAFARPHLVELELHSLELFMNLISRGAAATVMTAVAICSATLRADVYSDAVMSHNPLAYWRLGDAGLTAADFTGNGHVGAVDGAGTAVAFGQPSLVPSVPGNTAVTVTYNGQRILVPGFDKFPGGSTGYTVEYFLRPNAFPSGFANIVGDGDAVGDFYLMNYLSSAIRPHFNDTPNPGVLSIDSNVLTAGKTYHIASTWNQATGEGRVYIDGALSVVTPTSPNAGHAGTGSPVAGTQTNSVFIGRDNRGGAPGTNTATIDEAAIYNKALTSAQIQSHLVAAGFNGGVTKEFRTDGFGTFTTIAEPSSTDYANASSGNGVTFTLVSGTLHGAGAPDTFDLNDGVATAAPANANTFLPADGAANQLRVLIDLNQDNGRSLLISDIATFGTTTSDGQRAYQDYTLYGSDDLLAPSTIGDPLAGGWSLISDVIAFPDDVTLLTNAEYGVNIAVGDQFRYLLWVVDNHAAGLNNGAHYVEFDINGISVPEPTSVALWGLLSVIGVTLGWRTRRRHCH